MKGLAESIRILTELFFQHIQYILRHIGFAYNSVDFGYMAEVIKAGMAEFIAVAKKKITFGLLYHSAS